MSKKPIIGGIILVAIIGVVFVGAQTNPDNPENEESPIFQNTTIEDTNSRSSMKEIWRARMVGTEVSYSPPHESQSFPSSYVQDGMPYMQVDTYVNQNKDGVAFESNVPYQWRFVASGDSPQQIRITVQNNLIFNEVFHKERTLVDTGISEYYTWDYVGNKNFEISDEHCSSNCTYQIIVWRNVWYDDGGIVTISLSQ